MTISSTIPESAAKPKRRKKKRRVRKPLRTKLLCRLLGHRFDAGLFANLHMYRCTRCRCEVKWDDIEWLEWLSLKIRGLFGR